MINSTPCNVLDVGMKCVRNYCLFKLISLLALKSITVCSGYVCMFKKQNGTVVVKLSNEHPGRITSKTKQWFQMLHFYISSTTRFKTKRPTLCLLLFILQTLYANYLLMLVSRHDAQISEEGSLNSVPPHAKAINNAIHRRIEKAPGKIVVRQLYLLQSWKVFKRKFL